MVIETIMIAATTGVCSYVAGIVTMGLFTGGAATKWHNMYEEAIDIADQWRAKCRNQGREVADLRAEIFALNAIEHARQSGLREHNAKSRAKRLEREAAARELTQARHAEMRKIVGELV